MITADVGAGWFDWAHIPNESEVELWIKEISEFSEEELRHFIQF